LSSTDSSVQLQLGRVEKLQFRRVQQTRLFRIDTRYGEISRGEHEDTAFVYYVL
jgi:hypothetical protein